MTRSPGANVGHPRADAFDDAGEFAARRKREWRLLLVPSGDDQSVEEVETDGFHAHDDLARPRDRFGDIGKDELIGRAEMGAENGFHGQIKGSRMR